MYQIGHFIFHRKQHNLVLKTTDEIIQELERYFDTISASIETAKIGCHFTDEVAGLSKHVSKGRSMSTKDLRTFMASMLETANKASNQARVIEDKFGKIRVDLIKVISFHQLVYPQYVYGLLVADFRQCPFASGRSWIR